MKPTNMKRVKAQRMYNAAIVLSAKYACIKAVKLMFILFYVLP